MTTTAEILAENRRRLLAAASGQQPETEFEAWAKEYVKIKPKGGGSAVPFLLNRPQRRLVATLEKMRTAQRPIRLILLKARQWGGSTCIQLYMAWLQIKHSTGLNSLIIAHQISGSEEIRDMFERMAANYEPEKLTLKRVGRSGATYRIVERDCKLTIGTAERPDSSRGGDYNLVHLSEVGLWKRTKGKSPEDIVRSATSGVLLRPMTMIALESTANGAGTYFHREYLAAKEGESQFEALFIPWFEIEAYSLPLDDPETFAAELLEHRHDTTSGPRSVSGEYLWSLWRRGATLEAINWYRLERRKYADHGGMASEYPSDDIEAFVHSGERVFSPEAIERLRAGVRAPADVGDTDADGRFISDSCGELEVWKMPDRRKAAERYLAVVDVGGRSSKADWSVIAVFDRLGDDGRPEIVAQWRGHIDHDLLARKAAEIGRMYCDALLVIESNTLETHDRERSVDGLQAPFLLRELEESYPNLYCRVTTGGAPRPGFHTNTATKPMVIGTLVKALREGLYIERDRKAIEELIQYERKPNGSYGAYTGCHDDILMTRAIGLHISEFEMEPPRLLEPLQHRGTAPRGHRPQDSFGVF
ncbi:MAG: terminase [Muribaculaceae bacterium]|nr:terminase [Muribaculaceae bacterium]